MKPRAVLISFALAMFASTAVEAQQFYYPAQGQSQEQANSDRGECYVWATQQTGFDPANPQVAGPPPPGSEAPEGGLVRGAARGAAVGAVGGAIIGGKAGKGAALGAATGGLVGGMRRRDQRARENQNRRNWEQQQQATVSNQQSNFNRAMTACMQGRGYTAN